MRIARSRSWASRWLSLTFQFSPVGQTSLHVFGSGRRVESIPIKVTASPGYPFIVLHMRGIGDRCKKLCVSMHSTDILRWTSSFTFQTQWITYSLIRRQAAFKHNLVFPTIAVAC